MIAVERKISALDGRELKATLLEPERPMAAVIVNSATAVPRRFYRAFAESLMHAGAAVLTYDYRGSGDDPRDLRRSNARMRDWGEKDFAGAIDWMRSRYAALPLHAVGHSVGGHALLLAPNNAQLTRVVTVASQSGYWRLYRGMERYRVFAFMSTIMPLATRVYGYFPGRALRFGEDLAPGVLYEWSRWCASPGYFFDDPSMQNALANSQTLRASTLMIGLSDDPWGTRRAIDAVVRGFTSAPISRLELNPRIAGVKRIGHMGFFRAENGAALWPIVTKFLQIGAQ